jgi:uncharacterized protein YbjT (DUF2867 family)/uncharacterized membrane protein (DUF2068 family)
MNSSAMFPPGGATADSKPTSALSRQESPLILLTGATGYIGGRLLSALQESDSRVRCIARHPEHLQTQHSKAEIVHADCLDPSSLRPAMAGVHTAYYLVHSMGSSAQFEEADRLAARNFSEAARPAGVRRIIYLGGLAGKSGSLSSHLRSRLEVGDLLRQSGVPVIEFRASIVIGSGSLSFEMVRALVERLPVMICPRWVSVPAQPIAIEDLIEYLVQALDLPEGESRVFEIGGRDKVSYGDIMREYARERGLKRWLVSVSMLTPRLSSLWLGLVTPVYARVGRKLIESVRNSSVVQNESALQAFNIRPRGLTESIERTLLNEDCEFAATRWTDALPRTWAGAKFGNKIVDSRSTEVGAPPSASFAAVRRIGGKTGWYFADFLWRARGFIDLGIGGVGLRRGRRHSDQLALGDSLDLWRVEAFEPDRRLRLRAEMILPGRAWLQFDVEGDDSKSTIRQTAIFEPVGLSGLAYWYVLYPAHRWIFAGMLRGIAAAATRETNAKARGRLAGTLNHGQGQRGMILIGIFKLAKALLLVALGVGALKLLHKDVADTVAEWFGSLRIDPENRLINRLIAKLWTIDDRKLKEISAGTFCYAGLFFVEGLGLLYRKRWAQYMTIVTTSALLPLEVYEIAHRFTPVRALALLINLAIVIYLAARVRKK